jgi:hypothetical protein
MAACLGVAAASAADKCAAASEEGFVSIFNGKNLDGWIGLNGNKNDHYVKDGMLIVKDTARDHLFTEKEYANFIFRFEIKLDTGSNNGIGIRDKITKIPHLEGNELQVLDDSYFPCVKHGRKLELKEYQYHGSLYGVMPAKRGHLKPVGEWNQEEIICDGRRLKVILNGATIVDVDLDQVKPIDGHDKEHAGLKYEKGHIGLHAHGNYGAEVFFRNLRVKELK